MITLANTVLEAEARLADPLWETRAQNAFVCRAWQSAEDIRVYGKHLPTSYLRLLLAWTREHILEEFREIDAVLKH